MVDGNCSLVVVADACSPIDEVSWSLDNSEESESLVAIDAASATEVTLCWLIVVVDGS